jgi:hypothetical protein
MLLTLLSIANAWDILFFPCLYSIPAVKGCTLPFTVKNVPLLTPEKVDSKLDSA